MVRPGKDGRAVLHAQVATLHGSSIKYEFGDGKDNLGFWTNAEDFASWRLAIAKGGTQAVAAAKKLVFHAAEHDADAQLKLDQATARLIARLRVGAEGQEGMRAFLERRKPAWCDAD